MTVTMRVDTNLKTAAGKLFPRPTNVIQEKAPHSIMTSSSPSFKRGLTEQYTVTSNMIMMATSTRLAHPLRNTARMETDNILNRQVGRNTKMFLTIDLRSNSPPLAEMYFSIQGRLIVTADVIIERRCDSVADIERRTT